MRGPATVAPLADERGAGLCHKLSSADLALRVAPGRLIREDNECPHEMYIAADEFTNFSGAGNYEFFSLLGELWDCPDTLPVRTKNSKSFTINQPVVNIIAGNTHAGFAAAFPPDIMGQGFLSRMILVFGEQGSTRITFPTKPPAAINA